MLTHKPPFGQARVLSGSKAKGSCVLVPGLNENFLRTEITATLVSNRANLIPIQALGPCPKD